MSRLEIEFSGFGGQGIVLAGLITARGITLKDGLESVFTQSYGPEARGGACSSGIVIDEEGVDYPYVLAPDILVTMSQEAYKTYVRNLKKDGTLIYDNGLVHINKKDIPKGVTIRCIPSTKIAEELGNRIVANIVMLGFFTKVTGIVSLKGMKEAVSESVPKKFVDLNMNAFERGYDYEEEE